VPERGVTIPVYAIGRGAIKAPVFECPVSAIQPWIWDLLELFLQSRAMHLAPKVGGLIDQPLIVRRAFPVWEAEMTALEREQQSTVQLSAMAAMFGARRS
jgi:hypothetical protein